MDLPIDEVCGLVAALDATAVVDCPSASASLKDGYAVVSKDIEKATENNPVKLKLVGMSAAGDSQGKIIEPGSAIKVMTGALLPIGADAVLSVEFTREERERELFVMGVPILDEIFYCVGVM